MKSLLTKIRYNADKILPSLRPYYFLTQYPNERLAIAPIQALESLKNVFMLRTLVASVAPYCRKIVLYGSRGQGTNRPNSDIDLFFVTNYPDKVRELAKRVGLGLKHPLDLTIYSPNEAAQIQQKDSLFWDKLSNGVVIWLAPGQDITIQTKGRSEGNNS